jgi:hypothetical protein
VKRVRILFALGAAGVLFFATVGGCGISVKVDLGSDGGTIGGGGIDGDGGCWQTNKICEGECVPKNSVATGCGTSACEPCNVPNATPKCDDATGECFIDTCNSGFANCDPGFQEHVTGCEINTQNDVKNCGACGTDCKALGANFQCLQGACCETNCTPGWLNCTSCTAGGACDVPIDTQNCGACGLVCNAANATNQCNPVGAGYECQFACNYPWADCDGLPINGCEVNLATDLNHCGACNNGCTSASGGAFCNNGTCDVNCGGTGADDCDGNPVNGCETALNTPGNCGACGVPCSAPGNGTASCASFTCVMDCNPSFENCDGNWGNGCESLLSIQNCLSCGVACNAPHTTGAACSGGGCTYTGCQSGWKDCSTSSPGCETQLGTTQNCLDCGDNCTGGEVCLGSGCDCVAPTPFHCGTQSCFQCCGNNHCSAQPVNKCCINNACAPPPGDGGGC